MSSYTDQIAQLRREIQQYQALSGKVNAVIPLVDSAAGSTSRLDLELRSNYQVNGDASALTGRSTSLRNQLNKVVNTLRGTILPSISDCIARKQQEISRLEELERQRIEAERRRQEAERRRREEEKKRREEEKKRQQENKS